MERELHASSPFALNLIVWIGRVHPVPNETMVSVFFSAAAQLMLPASLLWLLYLALEPALRARWPHSIVTWNRIFAGRFPDAQAAAHRFPARALTVKAPRPFMNAFKISIDSTPPNVHTTLEHVQIHVAEKSKNRSETDLRGPAPMVTLEERILVTAPAARCFDLARSVEVHLAGNVHSGEAAVAMAGITSGLIGLGQRVTWRAKHFGVWQKLTSEITAMDRPAYFQDAMIRGAFRFMTHDHYFRLVTPAQTEMKDVFCFEAPLPILGRLAEMAFLRRYMQSLLQERNAVLKRIAESSEWRRYLPLILEGE